MTRLQVAGLLREPPGTIRAVDVGSLGWVDPSSDSGRPLLGSLRLQRTNRGILASGRLRTLVRRTCIRCLDEFDEPVDVSLEEEFLPSLDPKTGKALVVDPEDAWWRASTRTTRSTSVRSLPTSWPWPNRCNRCADPIAAVCARSAASAWRTVRTSTTGEMWIPRLASLADWKPPTD